MKLCNQLKGFFESFLPQTQFSRSVGILASGTVLAQLIAFFALPLVTRLYSPDEFAALAVYVAITSIFLGVATLRFDIAVPLPSCDVEAANLLALSLSSSMLFATAALGVILIFPEHIVALTGQPSLQFYLWMIPLGIMFDSACSAIQMWSSRKKRFVAIARTRIEQILGNTSTQLVFGFAKAMGPFGLLLGQLIGSVAGVFGLAKRAWREDNEALNKFSIDGMLYAFQKYNRFPKFSAIESLANNVSLYLPVVIIAAETDGPSAGYLFLAMKIMGIPLSLIGNSISQVYLSHAPEEYRNNRLGQFTLSMVSGLLYTGVGPLLFVGVISYEVFPLIFGAEWERAGEMTAWMMPWFIMQFLAAPISMALHVTHNQKIAMMLQIFGVFLRVGSVWFASLVFNNYLFEVFAVTGLVFYLLYFLTIAKIAGISASGVFAVLKQRAVLLFAWIGFAFAVIMLVKATDINKVTWLSWSEITLANENRSYSST
jgi:O-antigen/teichoic acid export membrane protein